MKNAYKKFSQNKEIFSKTAYYYDAMYSYKNYDHETQIINKLILKYSSNKPKSLLDVGCGTGEHLLSFAKRGYAVTGIDASRSMLGIAKSKQLGASVKLYQKDARNFHLHQQFEVITSLFHVLSYQVMNTDVRSFFTNIYNHLTPAGIVIFDCWHGPGVLNDKPKPQYKMFKIKNILIHRFKTPTLDENNNIVRVQHDFVIEDSKRNTIISSFKEIHLMRYFFYPEIEYFLQASGLNLLSHGPLGFPLGHPSSSWETYYIAQKT